MKYHCPEEKSYAQQRNGFNFLEEREKLSRNHAAARETSEKLSKIVNDIHRLHHAIEFEQANLQAVKVKLDEIAVNYGN